jgi:hypothetical protein
MGNGFMYLRKPDLSDLFTEVWAKVQRAGLGESAIPGSGVWNVITRLLSNTELGRRWHIYPLWEPEMFGPDVKTLHYTGVLGKIVRKHVAYHLGNPNILEMWCGPDTDYDYSADCGNKI